MLKLMNKIILIHLDGLPFGATPYHSAKGNSSTFLQHLLHSDLRRYVTLRGMIR